MRRPIIFLFLFFTLGIVLEYHLEMKREILILSFLVIVVYFFLLHLFAWFRKSQNQSLRILRIICFFLFVSFLGSAFLYYAENKKDPLEDRIEQYCTVQGRIITVQMRDEDSYKMLISANPFGKRLVSVRGRLEKPGDMVGSLAEISGTIKLPSERRNPNLFDYRLYLKTKDVRVIIETDPGHITLCEDHKAILRSMIAKLKYGFLEKLQGTMSPEAYGIMVGMMFGDRGFIDENTYEMFQKNGIAHILSVSGIHVGIVYLYLSKLLGNRKTLIFYILTAIFLIFYAALADFSPSVVRAVTMILIHIVSKITYRRYDFICCTAASALIMLLSNPFCLFNTGFQLSYMAVFCLAVMLPWTERQIRYLEEKIGDGFRVQLLRFITPLIVIQAGMFPLTAYLFNYFSIAAFFVNIPIIAISGLIIPIGISLTPLAFIGGLLFGVGAQGAELLIQGMVFLNDVVFLPGISYFHVVSPSAFQLMIFYGFFFLLPSEMMRVLYQRKKIALITVVCLTVVIVSFITHYIAGTESSEAGLIFLDVGQGDCLHIKTPGGKNILIDGGGNQNYNIGEKILLPYLLKSGVKEIDLAIATHLHDDHFLGICQLAELMKIKKLGTYEMNQYRKDEILEDTGMNEENLLYLVGGERINLEEGIWIDVLYPQKKSKEDYLRYLTEEEDENKSSLLLKVHYEGLTVLMTGDIGMEGEDEILRQYKSTPKIMDIDILKAGHHGSRFSTGDSFLDAVSPTITVFQVGKNNYGHPHSTVIEKCVQKGIMVYRNDLNGAIIFEEEGETWRIKVLLPKNMHIKKLTRI